MKQFIFLRLVSFIFFAFTFTCINALTNNFFIKDSFEKEGLLIKYSGVIKFTPSSTDDYKTDMSLNLYLASFFIEEITYNGEKYRNRELFGHTFPEEVLAKINIDAMLSFNGREMSFGSEISSFDKITYQLSESQLKTLKSEAYDTKKEFERGLGFKLKLLKTNSIKFPIDVNLIDQFINDITINKSLKTKEASDKEYARLLTEGNIFLNENNYKQSFASFSLAKEYAEDPEFINSKIAIVDSYLQKNRVSKYRWASKEARVNSTVKSKKELKRAAIAKSNIIDFSKDFKTTADKNKFSELFEEANTLFAKNEYDNALKKYKESKKFTKNKVAVKKQILLLEKFKNASTTAKSKGVKFSNSEKPLTNNSSTSIAESGSSNKKLHNAVDSFETTTKKNTIDSQSYAQLLKRGSDLLKSKNYAESKKYFEAAKQKAENKESVNKIIISVDKILASQQRLAKPTPTNSNSNINNYQSKYESTNTETQKITKEVEVSSLQSKAEILKTEFNTEVAVRGFIKYKRDEQAVLDNKNRVLIPFGKYEILRYRPGFANVRIKDNVEQKDIACVGKNDEYSWSARIYQNPWIETVVDDKGDFVDELNKKVEIYVVDNVSLLPFDEVPQRVIDAYKDPNQFTGTDFVSAFKLWEKENANRPDIIARRKEIQNFKDASKNEAYNGADRCKLKVSKAIEEVFSYYKKKGYEVLVKY